MGMSVGSDSGDEDTVVSEINTTPLVDVMLVLLIIFLITIPVVTTSVKVNLPLEKMQVREAKAENIVISVDPAGRVFFYDTPIKNQRDLVDKLIAARKKDDLAEVHIRGDRNANYEGVGKVILAVQRAGIVKVAFLTEPPGVGG